MSMISSSANGFGVSLFNGKNYGRIARFILDARKDEYGDISEADLEAALAGDVSDLFDDSPSCIIAEIINDAEEINLFQGFPECGDTDQEECFGVGQDFSWRFSEKSRSLSEDDVRAMIKKYAEKLGISEEPDYFTAYYYG